jgi:hypothetical protein
MIEVTEREDGSFDISWDENDPTESILNTWTEQDFIKNIAYGKWKRYRDLVTVEEVATKPANDPSSTSY